MIWIIGVLAILVVILIWGCSSLIEDEGKLQVRIESLKTDNEFYKAMRDHDLKMEKYNKFIRPLYDEESNIFLMVRIKAGKKAIANKSFKIRNK